jgi:hypothetical protein
MRALRRRATHPRPRRTPPRLPLAAQRRRPLPSGAEESADPGRRRRTPVRAHAAQPRRTRDTAARSATTPPASWPPAPTRSEGVGGHAKLPPAARRDAMRTRIAEQGTRIYHSYTQRRARVRRGGSCVARRVGGGRCAAVCGCGRLRRRRPRHGGGAAHPVRQRVGSQVQLEEAWRRKRRAKPRRRGASGAWRERCACRERSFRA